MRESGSVFVKNDKRTKERTVSVSGVQEVVARPTPKNPKRRQRRKLKRIAQSLQKKFAHLVCGGKVDAGRWGDELPSCAGYTLYNVEKAIAAARSGDAERLEEILRHLCGGTMDATQKFFEKQLRRLT